MFDNLRATFTTSPPVGSTEAAVMDNVTSLVTAGRCGRNVSGVVGRTLENHLWIYTAPLILLLSLCGNVMTILVMLQKSLRGTSTCVYLTVIAAADLTVVVIGIVPEWLEQMDLVSIWELSPWVCRVELYCYYTSLDFAIWVLVAFTFDRFVAVVFPFHKKRYCTRKRAYTACLIIFLLSNLNLHVFWTRGISYCANGMVQSNCGDIAEYAYFERSVRPWVVLALASLVPFVVILTSNVAIVVQLLRSRTARESKGFRQTTVMCLSISFAFLVLVTPNIVLLIGKKHWKSPDNVAYRVSRAIASQCVYINHSVNFLLYALTGTRFREELVARCHSLRRPVSRDKVLNRMWSVTPTEQLTVPSTPVTARIAGWATFGRSKSYDVTPNGRLAVAEIPS